MCIFIAIFYISLYKQLLPPTFLLCLGFILALSIVILLPVTYIMAIHLFYKKEWKKAVLLAFLGVLWVPFGFVLILSPLSHQSSEFEGVNNVRDCDGHPPDCLIMLAHKTKNASVCEEMLFNIDSGLKDRCYKNVALATSDSLICKLIKNSGDRADCYSSNAFSTGNASVCDNIESAYEQSRCKDSAKNSWIWSILKNFLG